MVISILLIGDYKFFVWSSYCVEFSLLLRQFIDVVASFESEA